MRIDKFRYKIEDIDVAISGIDEPITITSDKVKSFIIDRDYDRRIMAIFKINLALDKRVYYKILNNLTKAKFNIRITKSKYKTDASNKPEDTFKAKYINAVMVAISDTMSPNPTANMDNHDLKINNTTNEGNEFIPIELTLVDTNILKAYKRTVNINSTSNSASLINYILSKSGLKVLISPPDNTKNCKAIIPEQDIQDAIEYIHRTYGIYNTPYRLFSDIDGVSYFLNSSYDSKAFRAGEIKNVIIHAGEFSTEQAIQYGSYEADDSYNINISSKDIEVHSTSAISKEISSNKFKTSDGRLIGEEVGGFDTGDNITIIDDKNNNEFYMKSEISKMKESRLVIEFIAPEIDVSILTPNKRYNLIYVGDSKTNKELAGEYRIARCISVFEEDANMFSVNNAVQIKKV